MSSDQQAQRAAPPVALLEFINITKVCGGLRIDDPGACVANRNISLTVHQGCIHGLIGENGAGKSTLMKLLFGLDQPTSGSIRVRGDTVEFRSPLEAKARGIGMVHQHFMQAPQMTAIEHLALEHQSTSAWKNLFSPIPWKKIRQRLETIAESYHMPVPWDSPIEKLSIGYQQRIEILKLLDQGAEILIFDEPTAVLSPPEIEKFLQQLIILKAQGKTIILISHKLSEIKKVADEISVLRRGEVIWSGPAAEKSQHELAELMVGRRYEKTQFQPCSKQKSKILEIKNLSVHRRTSTSQRENLSKINLRLQRHEIVGIAGVEGNGQSDLVHALLNPDFFQIHAYSEVLLDGKNILGLHNREIRQHGLALIAEDRLVEAVVPAMKVMENFLLGQQTRKDFVSHGLVQWSQVRSSAEQVIHVLDVRPVDSQVPFASLSGGNQQKVVVGREISCRPKVLIAAHPTRGVDLHAIERIHGELVRLRDEGSGILLVSSDLDELFRLSDRIVVFCSGRIVAEFSRENFDEKKIGAVMGGLGETSA